MGEIVEQLTDTDFWEDEATTAEGQGRVGVKVGGMRCSLCQIGRAHV